MNIDQFAITHHARVRKAECGEPIINGKLWKRQPKPGRMSGHHIYEHGIGADRWAFFHRDFCALR